MQMVRSKMDQETLFNCVFVKFVESAAALKDQRKYNDALKLLSLGLENSKSCYECWLLQLCTVCWKNEKFKSLHGAVCTATDKKCFQDLLREEQGVPATIKGCFLELLTISNILYLEIIETSPGSSIVKTMLSKETHKQLMVSLKRVGSIIASRKLFDQRLNSSYNPFQDISYKDIKEELLNIIKNLASSKTAFDHFLASCVSLVTEYVLLAEFSCKDDLTKTLAHENTELAKRIEDTQELTALTSSSLILQVNALDLQYHSMLLSSLFNLICGDNDVTLKLFDEMETDKFPGNLHMLLKALLFFREEDYAQCCSIARVLCSQLENERLRKDDFLLSIAWNLVGVCFIMMKKPNIAIQVFDQSLKASSEYKAALKNLITSLKTLKEEDSRIRCLQLALQITESSSKSQSSLLQQFPDFQSIFLSKLCFEYLSCYKEIKIPGSNELVYLDLPHIDRSELLEELADALYQERRFKEASDVYLNLIHTIRHEVSITTSTRRRNIVHIFHKAIDTLFKSGRLQNAQTVCDHLLRLTTKNQEIISIQLLERMIDLDEDVVALLYKSEILRQLGDREEAIACLTRIINAFQDNEMVKEPQQKRPRIEECNSVLEENQSHVEIEKLKVLVYNNLGVTLLEVKDTKGAFAAFQNSIKFSSEQIEDKLLFNYCKLLLESKKHGAALKNWNDVNNAKETLGSLEKLLTENYKIMLWMDKMR